MPPWSRSLAVFLLLSSSPSWANVVRAPAKLPARAGLAPIAASRQSSLNPGNASKIEPGIAPSNLPSLASPTFLESSPEADVYLPQALAILESAILIDGHNDLSAKLEREASGPGPVKTYDLASETDLDTDIPKLREGRVRGQFWAAFVSGKVPTKQMPRRYLKQVKLIRGMIDRYSDHFRLALSADDVARSAEEGRIASLIGIEGGNAIGNSLKPLRKLFKLGARYMTLTHNDTTAWADSATDKPRHNGLSKFGVSVVKEMNRLGMMVDLSHVSEEVMDQAITVSKAPIIFSHSNARALSDHKRNIPTPILERIPENGGLVMATFIPEFVSQATWDWNSARAEKLGAAVNHEDYLRIRAELEAETPYEESTISQVADQIEYIVSVVGYDHIGISGDFYQTGWDVTRGLENVSKYPALFAELLRRGWNESNLKKLAGKNLLRVMKAVEKAALPSPVP